MLKIISNTIITYDEGYTIQRFLLQGYSKSGGAKQSIRSVTWGTVHGSRDTCNIKKKTETTSARESWSPRSGSKGSQHGGS